MKIFEFNSGQKGSLIDSVSGQKGVFTPGTSRGFVRTSKGLAMEFDGDTTSIDSGRLSSDVVGDNCYIEVWFKLPELENSKYLIFTQRSSGSTFMSIVVKSPFEIVCYYANDSGGVDTSALVSGILVIGKWYHLVMIREDISTLKLYIDSILLDTVSNGGQSAADYNLFIGSTPTGSSVTKSMIAKVRTGLISPSQSQINTLYKEFLQSYPQVETKENFVLPVASDLSHVEGLVAAYNFKVS